MQIARKRIYLYYDRLSHYYLWRLIKGTIVEAIDDDILTLSAALSYYTALSLAPLVVLLFYVAGFLGADTQAAFFAQMKDLVGPQVNEMIYLIIQSTKDQSPSFRNLAGIFGIGMLLVSATAVFGQLQFSLNRIWNICSKPQNNFISWIEKRLLSIGMIMAIGFLLLVSLSVTAILQIILRNDGDSWKWINHGISLAVYFFLFDWLFKYLPDVKIKWKDAALGAFITAIFFDIGRFLIGIYLRKTAVASSYGAAGSLFILLVWVYYSSAILFLGAELTQVRTKLEKGYVKPSAHAEKVPDDKPSSK